MISKINNQGHNKASFCVVQLAAPLSDYRLTMHTWDYLLRLLNGCTDELQSPEEAIEAIDTELRELNGKVEKMIRDGEEHSYFWQYCARRKRILEENRARHESESTSSETDIEFIVSTFTLEELNDSRDRASPSPSPPRCLDSSRFLHSLTTPSRADLLNQANRCLNVWQSSLDAIEIIYTELRALNKKVVELIQDGRENCDHGQELAQRNTALREDRARHDATSAEMAQEFSNTREEIVKLDNETKRECSPRRRRRSGRRQSPITERVNRRSSALQDNLILQMDTFLL